MVPPSWSPRSSNSDLVCSAAAVANSVSAKTVFIVVNELMCVRCNGAGAGCGDALCVVVMTENYESVTGNPWI